MWNRCICNENIQPGWWNLGINDSWVSMFHKVMANVMALVSVSNMWPLTTSSTITHTKLHPYHKYHIIFFQHMEIYRDIILDFSNIIYIALTHKNKFIPSVQKLSQITMLTDTNCLLCNLPLIFPPCLQLKLPENNCTGLLDVPAWKTYDLRSAEYYIFSPNLSWYSQSIQSTINVTWVRPPK